MRPKIYLFGDSITEESFSDGGWGSNLAHHFSRTADVVLRGYGGYNTRWALKMKEKAFPPPPDGGGPPLAVMVFFGAHDASLPYRCSGFQHVPLDEYKHNLTSIVAFLKLVTKLASLDSCFSGYIWLQKKWPSARFLLITPPPVDEAARLRDPDVESSHDRLPERTNEATGRYAEQCLAVAAEFGVSAIDLWTTMQHFPGWQNAFLRDGLHLTPRGNKVVFEEVIVRLRENGVSLETLIADLPLIGEINPLDPLKSFPN